MEYHNYCNPSQSRFEEEEKDDKHMWIWLPGLQFFWEGLLTGNADYGIQYNLLVQKISR
jgi:hypothetical protein